MEHSWAVPLPSENRPGLGDLILGGLDWDGEFGEALLSGKPTSILDFVTQRQHLDNETESSIQLNHDGDSVTLYNKYPNTVAHFTVTKLWSYKTSKLGSEKAKGQDVENVALKYGQSYQLTNQEGQESGKWYDRNKIIVYNGTDVLDEKTGKPVPGGKIEPKTDVAPLSPEDKPKSEVIEKSDIWLYGGLVVAVIAVAGVGYWWLKKRGKEASA